jgi:hypothetical protein
VSATQHASIGRQSRHHVIDEVLFAARMRLLVRDIHGATADQPDTKHDAFHVPHTRRAQCFRLDALARP